MKKYLKYFIFRCMYYSKRLDFSRGRRNSTLLSIQTQSQVEYMYIRFLSNSKVFLYTVNVLFSLLVGFFFTWTIMDLSSAGMTQFRLKELSRSISSAVNCPRVVFAEQRALELYQQNSQATKENNNFHKKIFRLIL